MALTQFLAEFGHGIDGRIDFATGPRLRFGQGIRDLLEGRVADDQEVEIAGASQLAPRGRSEHEGNADPVAQRRQCLAEELHDTCGLEDERLQLGEDRRVAIGLEVDLPSLDGPPQQPAAGQRSELTLYGPLGGARLTHDLAQVEGFIRVPQQPRQHSSARLPEEDASGGEG
jgi:hypothetical protein